ncbi:MAG TPA: type II toxin-antitoxin system RelE/ParE family toxin [Acidimicrobiia bacterium]
MQAVYYRDSDGVEPVNDFIDALPPERQEELDFKIGLLNRLTSTDPPLPFPHSSQVDGQLRELRCHYGRDLYRILYQRSGNLFVLVHAIEKRTGALPVGDIELAAARFADLRKRIGRQAKAAAPGWRARRSVDQAYQK